MICSCLMNISLCLGSMFISAECRYSIVVLDFTKLGGIVRNIHEVTSSKRDCFYLLPHCF